MKPISRILLSALLSIPLLGCQDERGGNKTVFQVDPNQGRYGYKPDDGPRNPKPDKPRDVNTNPTNDPADIPPIDPLAENAGTDPGATTPEIGPQPLPDGNPGGTTNPQPAVGAPPFAKQVPGMSGYVFSPFAAGKKIEVIGYPPGTVVKCPYTQKEFKVP